MIAKVGIQVKLWMLKELTKYRKAQRIFNSLELVMLLFTFYQYLGISSRVDNY